uniref:Lecithin retinol acyltransferase n=1 Tax=Candidatus Kentrum sp. SD TaxID=2126332 RepID=A0A450Y823_9GAMM|nr:MAG: Lecithin retinol acyltransferase [Candidatus Kentron sp. SD]VFK41327.1 MAG: Lecithin retinol acyltransferase [Candidatus Kentron sp. SD]VFK80103.1 MAG: Lecithin retinol acyltransferase [Candidatus Kentron sp. SD]
MPKGDHLAVSRGVYLHHGLDLGDERVMQYGGNVGASDARVEVVDRETFSQGNPIMVVNKSAAYPPDEIIARAERRLGERDYSLIRDNCEHFVNWCRTGENESRQVECISERAVSSIMKLAASQLAQTALKSSVKATAKTVTRGVTPWLLIADGAQLVTEFATAQMGVEEKEAETAGQMVGVGTSVCLGALAGGPLGGLVCAGLWAAGEMIGKRVTSHFPRESKEARPSQPE